MNLKKLCLVFILSSPTLFVLAQKGDVTASVPQKESKTASKSKDKKADKTEDKSETITDKKAKKTSDKADKKNQSTTANATPLTNSVGRGMNATPIANIRNAGILNSDKDDFSPTFYKNGLLFCSSVKKTSKKGDDDKTQDDINLRYAEFDSLGTLLKPASFGHRANTKTNEGPSCFSAKEDTLYLSRNASKGGKIVLNKNGKATLKIYIKSRDTTGNFVGEEILPFESETFSYCHPTLSADGNRLYFSSDMPGGFGGMDLWVARRLKDGTWSQPINLGARVNTAKNEVFPFMTNKGSLYFASDGIVGSKGGYDLYRIEIEHRTARAFPMGEPFNTEFDDFGIMFMPKNENKGYFSSNRKGGTGGDDIYEFEMKK